MVASSSNILFDDIFTVENNGLGPERNYERVARIVANSQNHEMKVVLDVNSDLISFQDYETFTLTLASSLSESSTSKHDVWRLNEPTLADDYEYVCSGKVYKFDGSSDDRVTAFISIGGLIMALTGSYRHMGNINTNSHVYVLIRR